MGTPGNKAVTDNYSLEAISSLITKHTKDGKLELPDDLDPALAFAATAETRRRNTQAEYTRIKQENIINAKKLEALQTLVPTMQVNTLTEEQNAELEELKKTDVDAWYNKRNEYEKAARIASKATLDNTLSTAETAGKAEQEDATLKVFNANSPHEITREDLRLNIPPRIIKAYESGAITFNDVLVQASTLLFPSTNTNSTGSTKSNVNDENKLVSGYTSSFDAFML